MALIPIISIGNSLIQRDGNGNVIIFDKDAPITISVSGDSTGQIASLTITPKPGYRLTASALGRIPLQQIAGLIKRSDHPNDMLWRQIATQRTPGMRSWPDSHWIEVRDVCDWARESKRPGGKCKAIADLWSVSHATAVRWAAKAERGNYGKLSSSGDD